MSARVLVAMSGGVDSSVAAALLARDGYDVVGVTFNQWPADLMARSTGNGCCTPDTIDDARRVCAILGVPHYVIDYRREFETAVIDPWVKAYLNGQTPNPCIMCNRSVRFGSFLTRADELGANFIATGHYARVESDKTSGRFRLLTALDPGKDQSYVLHVLGQRQLARTLLPLGHLTKREVRRLAAEFDLPVAFKADSQEICFVPDNDHAGYVRAHGSTGPGDIVDTAGQVVGRHDGLEAVTPGQRRGLNLGGGSVRRYVVELDPAANRVTVGARDESRARQIQVRDVNWVDDVPPSAPRRVGVRTRYRMPLEDATLVMAPGGVTLQFGEPTWAPAPGQAAVFYAGDQVLGGGTVAAVTAR
ncbi:MAG: tRNA 2-thiouridine(34) synthase MnmA [Chloroflexi bacterium]|nr:tRNA 2-thiouridine(34) synthase MnmA [Chloroflexota bacterium]